MKTPQEWVDIIINRMKNEPTLPTNTPEENIIVTRNIIAGIVRDIQEDALIE